METRKRQLTSQGGLGNALKRLGSSCKVSARAVLEVVRRAELRLQRTHRRGGEVWHATTEATKLHRSL